MVSSAVVVLLACTTAVDDSHFYLLNASSDAFARLYAEDLPWAVANAPFFEASESSFTEAFAFRWRLFKHHIVATPGAWNGHPPPSYVITEFDPSVHVGQAMLAGEWVEIATNPLGASSGLP